MGQTEGILGGFCKRAVSVRGIRACFPDRQRHFWHLVPVMFSSGACRESNVIKLSQRLKSLYQEWYGDFFEKILTD